MTLRGLTPNQLAILIGALTFVLLLVYLIRFRRKGQTISSILLWQKVVGARRSIWQEILAFFLHLLILILIAFAIADPAPVRQDIARRYVALIVDSSLSMGALADKGSRMDEAVTKGVDFIKSLREVDRAMVIAAGNPNRAMTVFTSKSDVLASGLKALRPSGRAPKFTEAIEYAKQAFEMQDPKAGDSLAMIILTDQPDKVQPPVMQGVSVDVIGVGKPDSNTAITDFDVRKPLNASAGHELMLRVVNFGDKPSTATLVVYTPAATVGKETITLNPGQEKTQHYYLPFGISGNVTALLQDIKYPDGPDPFGADDAAFAYIGQQKKFPVLLVTTGNVFLQKALQINPMVSLKTIAPSAYSHGMSYGAGAVIFENFTPPQPPASNAVYIHPTAAPFSVSKKVEKPQMTSWNDGHPALRYIAMDELNIAEANPIVAGKNDTILAGHYENGLIVEKNIGGRKVLGIGFSLKKSDLPLRVAFPILFHNIINWFAETDDIERRTGHQIGQTLTLPFEQDQSMVAVTQPNNEEMTLYPKGGLLSLRLANPGFYSYMDGEKEKIIAASLLDRNESNLLDARSDTLAPLPKLTGKAGRERFWPYLILLAFLLVVADFWLYNNGKLP